MTIKNSCYCFNYIQLNFQLQPRIDSLFYVCRLNGIDKLITHIAIYYSFSHKTQLVIYMSARVGLYQFCYMLDFTNLSEIVNFY